MAQIRIISDGLPYRTSVTVDGQPLQGVTAIEWKITHDNFATATITIENVPFDLTVTGELAEANA